MERHSMAEVQTEKKTGALERTSVTVEEMARKTLGKKLNVALKTF